MQKVNSLVLVVVMALVCSLCIVQAYPTWNRNKRVSDQRLAELETLLALARLKGRFANVQVGYGFINPNKIGRKKRAVDDLLLQLDQNKSSSSDDQLMKDEEQSNDHWPLKASQPANKNSPLKSTDFST